MEGTQVLLVPPGRHLRARLPGALRRRRAALLHRRRRPGEPTTPTSPGPSSSAATTTSWSPAGATWSTGRSRWRRRTSARSPTPGELTAEPTRRCCAGRPGRLRHGRRPDRPAPAEGGDRRGDAGRRRGQQVPLRPGAVEAQGRGRQAAAWAPILHVALQVVSDAQHAAHAVPAALRAEGARAARRHRACTRRCRAIEEVDDLDGGPAYPVLTGDYTVGARWESVPLVGGHAAGRAEAGLPQARPVDRRGGAGPAAPS